MRLASLAVFCVSIALALVTTYNIKHDAPWVSVAYQLIEKQVNQWISSQVGKGSSLIVVDQLDDYSPPAWSHMARLISTTQSRPG